MTIRVEPLTGPALIRALPALARLRITVFREWPYLYEGTVAHEFQHLIHHDVDADDAVHRVHLELDHAAVRRPGPGLRDDADQAGHRSLRGLRRRDVRGERAIESPSGRCLHRPAFGR